MEPDTSSDQRPVIQASEILAKIERGEDVEYDGVIVEGDLDISRLDLPTKYANRTEEEKLMRGLSDEQKVISSQITITNSEIKGKVNFSNSSFQELISFEGTKFVGHVSFMKYKFDFSGAKFGKSANFAKTEFIRGYFNFFRAEFGGMYATFGGAKFIHGTAEFEGAEFGGDAVFSRAEFTGGNAYFTKAKFSGSATFGEAKFSGGFAYFGYAEFGGFANFMKAKFGGDVIFERAEFTGRNAYFREANFSGTADFREANFSEMADFRESKFGGNVSFEGAKFGGGFAYFEGAEFDKELILNNFKYERLYINWSSIKGKLVYSGPVYLALIKNFKIIERFSDADDCYYDYRKKNQTQKKWYSKENRLIEFFISCYGWTSAQIRQIYEYLSWINNYPPFTWIHRFNWSKLLDWIGFVSCGYGVRLVPIFFWVLGSFLGFAFLYKLLPESYGGITESGPSTVTMEAVNNSTLLLTFCSGDGALSPSWGECLYFSFTALTGGTPDGLHPVGLCKYAVMIEGVLGYLFLALFVVVLARKIIR